MPHAKGSDGPCDLSGPDPQDRKAVLEAEHREEGAAPESEGIGKEAMTQTCTQSGCDQAARFEVFWPGKTVLACEDHLKKLLAVASAMGFTLDYRLTPEESQPSEGERA
jgi:hypothetical protein